MKENNIDVEILSKAEKILKEKKHYQTCIKAGICPKCGSDLSEYTEKIRKDLRYFFLFKKSQIFESYHLVCSENIEHIKIPNRVLYEKMISNLNF